MIKKITDALKTKFEGVDEKILQRVAKKLAETTTDENLTTVIEGVTFQTILDRYGDSRATEATQSAIANYEKKYNLKDGKLADAPKPTEEPDNNTPEWAKQLIKVSNALSTRIENLEKEKTTTSRKGEFEKIISKLPENLRKPYTRIALDSLSEEDFNTLKTEVENEVTSINDSLKVKGATFGRPSNSQHSQTEKEASDDEINAVVDKFNI